MILRALRLQAAIQEFVNREESCYNSAINGGRRKKKNKDSLTIWVFENRLTSEDWSALGIYNTLLSPLAEATMLLQGRPKAGKFVGLGHVIPTFTYLFKLFERFKTEFQNYPDVHFIISIEHGWSKLRNYYERLDDSPAYVAASIFDL